MTHDPTRAPGRWDGLHRLLKQMDTEIEEVYARRGVEGMRSRFVRPLIRIAHEGPQTISDLAHTLGATHSATSQTVAAMKRAGFVRTRSGTDGRTQVVALTPAATDLLPVLEAEWRGTEAVVAGLDDELDGAVTALADRLAQALEQRSMTQRLEDEIGRQE